MLAMSGLLEQLYRHHRWANLALFDFCAGLDESALALSAPGAYGTIRDTWRHVANGERNYLAAVQGTSRDPRFQDPSLPLATIRAELVASADELLAVLGTVTEGDTFEADWGGKSWTLPKFVPLLQAIDHGREHRTNITTILQAHGIEAPQIDLWAYGNTLAPGPQSE